MEKCNPEIIVLEDGIQGTGDQLDIRSQNLIHIKEPENLNIDALCFRGTFNEQGALVQDNRTIIDFEVEPGFFYVGDKEYNLFSQKVTDVIKVDADGNLQLKDHPNGYSHIGLYGPFVDSDFGGLYHEELIEKQKVLYSKYLNETSPLYRYSESGYSICYDTSGYYPGPIPPEIPIGQCFTYWEPVRKCNPLDPSTYSYDLLGNSIKLLQHPVKRLTADEILLEYSDDEVFYIAEYERSSLKTLTGSNFNPMAHITNEGFLVINPDLDTKIPDRIQIVDPTNRSGSQQTTIVFEAFNFENNLIKNLAVDVTIKRTFIDQVSRPVDYIIKDFNEYYTEYEILNPINEERVILENGSLVFILPANATQMVLKTEGLISGSQYGPFAYNAASLINQDGIGIVYFISPQIEGKEQKVQLDFSFKGISLKTIEIRNYNFAPGKSILFSETSNFRSEVAPIKRDANGAYILLENVATTLNLSVYTLSDFSESQASGRNPKALILGRFSIDGNFLRTPITLRADQDTEEYAVIHQIDLAKNYITLDSSIIYGL